MGTLRDIATGQNWQKIPDDVRAAMLSEDAKLERQAAAISKIAPFLSASLEMLADGHDGTYEAACNAVFECDIENFEGDDENDTSF